MQHPNAGQSLSVSLFFTWLCLCVCVCVCVCLCVCVRVRVLVIFIHVTAALNDGWLLACCHGDAGRVLGQTAALSVGDWHCDNLQSPPHSEPYPHRLFPGSEYASGGWLSTTVSMIGPRRDCATVKAMSPCYCTLFDRSLHFPVISDHLMN